MRLCGSRQENPYVDLLVQKMLARLINLGS